MAKIKFRGKEYNSLADMPAKERHDYFKARAGYDVPEEPKNKTDMMPSGLENMPPEVRTIYEHVRGNVGAKSMKASPVDNLPTTEDLYRRSAPATMRNQPSDESVYKPSPPIIESDHTLRRLVIGLVVAVVIIGIFLALYFGV